MKFLDLVCWKKSLLESLNNGHLDASEWQDFIRFAFDEKCVTMAYNMQKRLEHYQKWNAQKETK